MVTVMVKWWWSIKDSRNTQRQGTEIFHCEKLLHLQDPSFISFSLCFSHAYNFILNTTTRLHYILPPHRFAMIWKVVKPMVDEVTLQKISIVRGQDAVFAALLEKIPVENIPPEYGGKSTMKLGDSPEEVHLRDLITHNNALANGDFRCGGKAANPPCRFCSWGPTRSY